jgi:hypothetical protein
MQHKLTVALAGFIIGAGVYLTATPLQAAASSVNCWDQASAIHTIMESFCGGEANCSFQCSTDFRQVDSMSCSCA